MDHNQTNKKIIIMNTIKQKSNRTFGVEVEFHGSNLTTVASKLSETGILVVAEGYNHTTRGHWKVVPDGSCSFELVSPILKGQDGMNQTVTLLDALSNIRGVRVDKQCGVHVHVGVPDATGKKVANLVKYFGVNEHIIDMVLSPSRRDSKNTYCKSVFEGVQSRNTGRYTDNGMDVLETSKTKLFNECNKIVKRDELNGYGVASTISDLCSLIGRNNGCDRYSKLNLASYRKYRTIEYRCFNGSLDSQKIGHWINFCCATVDKTFGMKQVKNRVMDDSRLAFAQVFGKQVGRKTLKFMGERAENFGLLSNAEDMFNFSTRNGTV